MATHPRSLLLASLASLALLHPGAFAADAVTDAMQAAYAPYRSALFRTNSKSQAESEQAMASTRAAWAGVVQRHGSTPTAPYDRDPQFRTTLVEVDGVFGKAQALVQSGQLAQAHEVLEQARDLLAELRARNGVITFSDRMNDYHAQMETVLDKGEGLLEQPAGLQTLTESAGVLAFLAARLRETAPAELKQDSDFLALQAAIQQSVDRLRAALLSRDATEARKAMEGMKGPYSRMFVRYG